MGSAIWSLIKKDWLMEWRQKYALGGIMVYVVSTVFLVYISFLDFEVTTWNTLFWIIMLFTSVNAVMKSFVQEHEARKIYYYTIASPTEIIISKILYNMALMLVIGLSCLWIYSIVAGYPVEQALHFILTVILGAIGFAVSLTMIAAIAARAKNSGTLMAILSFPVLLPMLLLLIRLSESTLSGHPGNYEWNFVVALLAIDVISFLLAYILFPYLWRD